MLLILLASEFTAIRSCDILSGTCVSSLMSHVSCVDKVVIMQIYSEEDRSKMPLELGTALSIEREPVNDPEIRTQALEAIYLIILQVNLNVQNIVWLLIKWLHLYFIYIMIGSYSRVFDMISRNFNIESSIDLLSLH